MAEVSKNDNATKDTRKLYEQLIDFAAKGWFPKIPYTSHAIDISNGFREENIEKREYAIRFAQPEDMPYLMELEELCWPEKLRCSAREIEERIKNNAAYQFVLVKGNKVVGVNYTQRITNQEAIYNVDCTQIPTIRSDIGNCIQLIALNVLPEYQDQGMGHELLEFVLQYFSLLEIEHVIAVTRCRDFYKSGDNSIIEYLQRKTTEGLVQDPILRFHQIHGADILGIIENYRPFDHDNEGLGILIRYDMKTRPWGGLSSAIPFSRPDSKEGKSIRSSILQFIKQRVQAAHIDFNKSMNALGIDSLDLMDLITRLRKEFCIDINLSKLSNSNLEQFCVFCEQQVFKQNEAKTSSDGANREQDDFKIKLSGILENYPEAVPLQTGGNGCLTFWIHPMSGDVGIYAKLAEGVNDKFRIIGIKSKGFLTEARPHESLEEKAEYYNRIVTAIDPVGPYHFAGFSFGGVIAYEMARQLQNRGKQVASLMMVESMLIEDGEQHYFQTSYRENLVMNANFLLLTLLGIDSSFQEMVNRGAVDWADYHVRKEMIESIEDSELADFLAKFCVEKGVYQPIELVKSKILSMAQVHLSNLKSFREYRPQKLPLPLEVKCYMVQTESAKATSSKLWNPDYLEKVQDSYGSLHPFLKRWKRLVPHMNTIILEGENHFDLLREEGLLQLIEHCASIYRQDKKATIEVSENKKENNNKAYSNTDIAIIGMSGIFPDAGTVEEFWNNLCEGRESVSEVPAERKWNIERYYDSRQQPKKTYVTKGAFLRDIDKFDPEFFMISPKEAELMDPTERIFLQQAWKAIEDAGYAGNDLSGKNWGVYAGVAAGDYDTLINQNYADDTYIQASSSFLPSRISYFLNLTGPAVSIDTACSSSLSAIAYACDSLILGNCETAIAGGAAIYSTPKILVTSSQSMILSPDGKCFAFDQRANGTALGEGVGVLILKPMARAIADNDHIYGVIKGWGTNYDGKTNGITAPSASSQTKLYRNVYSRYSIDPSKITLVEAHGTGTKLGDSIEFQALCEAFGGYTDKKGYCALGSVKANVGHAFAAAGVTGLIKVLLSIKNKQIPPSINYENGNEYNQFQQSPFFINTKIRDWDVEPGGVRCAAVNSFGVSGINAHVVVEEYPDEKITKNKRVMSQKNKQFIFALSAKTEEQLMNYAREYVLFLSKKQTVSSSEAAKNLPSKELEQELKKFVLEQLSNIINVPVEEINTGDKLSEYGVDPIHLMKLIEKIRDKFNLDTDINVSSIKESIDYLVDYILSLQPEISKEEKYNEVSLARDSQGSTDLDLDSLAYTLQVGREAMEERMGIIFESAKELEEKLSLFVEGRDNIEGLYRDRVKRNKETLDVFAADEDMEKLVDAWICKGKYKKILSLWVKGLNFGWNKMYGDCKPYRISLPTYPFVKQRHWVKEIPKEYIANTGREEKEVLRYAAKEEKEDTTIINTQEDINNSVKMDDPKSDYVAPRNGLELRVSALWEEALGFDKIGVFDHFTNLGADSIKTTQIISKLKSCFPFELSLKELFTASNVSQMAELLEKELIDKIEELPDETIEQLNY
ncbi:MAG: GNAT family N-acetyltransferase [Clostridia bacterium]|nr:GNAT family N-acetyltransferase [Clostridia bacterium]